jgi:hypothetical protein
MTTISNSSNYGSVIQRETQEWSKSPIVDIVYKNLTDPICPPDYEMVTGTFMGTKDYCVYLIGDYTVGRCKRKRGLYTVQGIDPLSFNKFQNQILCAKRDKALDYHQLALERDSRSCPSTSGCGSDSDANKRFCFKNTAN